MNLKFDEHRENTSKTMKADFGGSSGNNDKLDFDLNDVTEAESKLFVAKTFAELMFDADYQIQSRYAELKNYALRYKKLKSRISRKFDSINKGRLHFVKLAVAGKTLKLYLNMSIDDTEPKFHCVDMSDTKTYFTVPVQMRIKSDRAMNYAKILIDKCAEFHGLKENKKYSRIDAIALVKKDIEERKG